MKPRESENNLDLMQRTTLKSTIVIRNLITLYYFEHGKDFVFRGEKHNFWEILYVDRGNVEVHTDDACHVLKQGSAIFHKPNEFHRFHAAKGIAPNVIVITFDCRSEAIRRFENRVLQLNDEERNMLVRIIEEGRNAFAFPFSHPLKRLPNAAEGSEQLLRCYLEVLLLRLLRKLGPQAASRSPLSSAARENTEDATVRRIVQFLEERQEDNPTAADIAGRFYLSEPRLRSLFRKHTGCSIKQYMIRQKIATAKVLIREETYNYTEISRQLGFSSVHYFSRLFKKEAGMSPSEYARSVKARMR